jgi:hypothetical protein
MTQPNNLGSTGRQGDARGFALCIVPYARSLVPGLLRENGRGAEMGIGPTKNPDAANAKAGPLTSEPRTVGTAIQKSNSHGHVLRAASKAAHCPARWPCAPELNAPLVGERHHL